MRGVTWQTIFYACVGVTEHFYYKYNESGEKSKSLSEARELILGERIKAE